MRRALITVVETPRFLVRARKVMSDDMRVELVDFLASNPEAGDLVAGTGGMRKLRWALEGRGKSGGARVIYYFHSETIPLFVITAYAKNERDNISEEEKNEFRQFAKELAAEYGRKR